ncbi:MAG: hypothetical protein AAFX76_12880 [Planctomycetota bacterium]
MIISQLIICTVAASGAAAAPAHTAQHVDVSVANGIAAVGETIYVGGMTAGRIVRVGPGGGSEVLTAGHPRVRSVAALRHDPATGLLWGTAPDAFGRPGPAGETLREPSVVFAVDPQTGHHRHLIDFPPGAFTNDLVVAPDGTRFVTDSLGGRVWRIPRDARTPVIHVEHPLLAGGGLGAAGIALDPDGTLYVNTYTAGRLLRIRGQAVEPLRTSRPLRNPDGMLALPDGNLLVLEGNAAGDAGRLLRLDIDGLDAAVTDITEIDMPLNLTPFGGSVVLTDAAARPWLRGFLAGDAVEAPAASRLIRIPLNTKQNRRD